MIILENNTLNLQFSDVHAQARLNVSFQRTLRIPDDNREYPLPAGLGRFPLFHVDDFSETVPNSWVPHGGVFMPMYQSEAMWINFHSDSSYPFALKICAGKINAVTGEEWNDSLSNNPQDYVVIPEQPWLDGFCIREGLIRQFVAMPLGDGFTAEGQITGKEEAGGLQLIAYPMKRDYFDLLAQRRRAVEPLMTLHISQNVEMGLAPGGLMRQQIYKDPYGLDAWDFSKSSRCFVHLANSASFHAITGCRPPTEPMSAEQYRMSGIPWFSYWDSEKESLKGSKSLAGLDSVAATKIKKGQTVKESIVDISSAPLHVIKKGKVRDGSF